MARRQLKKSAEKDAKDLAINWRLWSRWSMGIVVLGLLAAGGVWGVEKLKDPNVLPLKVVRIDGDFRYLNRAQLEQVVGVAIKGSFFSVDLDSVKQAALDLPWVKQVTVRRHWPDTLQMVVVERVPLARWGKGQLISVEGVVFKPEKIKVPDDLPLLHGPLETAQEVASSYYRYRQMLSVLDLQVRKLTTDSRSAWFMQMDNGLVVKLGNNERQQRMEKFIHLYPLLVRSDKRQIHQIDLRYTNGAAVQWGEQTTSAIENRKQSEDPIQDIRIKLIGAYV